jgi:hypothetical protein
MQGEAVTALIETKFRSFLRKWDAAARPSSTGLLVLLWAGPLTKASYSNNTWPLDGGRYHQFVVMAILLALCPTACLTPRNIHAA